MGMQRNPRGRFFQGFQALFSPGRKAAALLFLFPALPMLGETPCAAQPGQAPPPPRARTPVASPKKSSQAFQLLELLREIREAQAEVRRKAKDFEREKKALEEEIGALKKRTQREREELARLQGEVRARREKAKEAGKRAKEAEAALREAVRAGKKTREELSRLTRPRGNPSPARPPSPSALQVPAFLARLFLGLEEAAGRARAVEVQRRKTQTRGKTLYRDYLRLGGVITLWRSLDGKEAGWIDEKTGKEIPFPPELGARASEGISRAVQVLSRETAPEICLLPFPLLHLQEKEEKR